MPEKSVEDDSLDKVIAVRKQRLARFEHDCVEARAAWRTARAELRQAKRCWRVALQEANDYWQQARAEFFKMTTTSGQFRKAKTAYERMKSQAAQLLLECRQAVASCRAARDVFFSARRNVVDAMRRKEKLCIMRDEIRSAQ